MSEKCQGCGKYGDFITFDSKICVWCEIGYLRTENARLSEETKTEYLRGFRDARERANTLVRNGGICSVGWNPDEQICARLANDISAIEPEKEECGE